MLSPYGKNLGLWMAGHIHIDYDYPLVNNVMKEFANANTMSVFPNPNNGKFTVAEELFASNTILRLYDVLGTLIYEKQMKDFLVSKDFYQFDFSFLPKGSYYISVADGDKIYSQRLVMQ